MGKHLMVESQPMVAAAVKASGRMATGPIWLERDGEEGGRNHRNFEEQKTPDEYPLGAEGPRGLESRKRGKKGEYLPVAVWPRGGKAQMNKGGSPLQTDGGPKTKRARISSLTTAS